MCVSDFRSAPASYFHIFITISSEVNDSTKCAFIYIYTRIYAWIEKFVLKWKLYFSNRTKMFLMWKRKFSINIFVAAGNDFWRRRSVTKKPKRQSGDTFLPVPISWMRRCHWGARRPFEKELSSGRAISPTPKCGPKSLSQDTGQGCHKRSRFSPNRG